MCIVGARCGELALVYWHWFGLGYIFVTGCVGLWLGVRGYVWLCRFTGGCVGLRMGKLGSSYMHWIEVIVKRF